MGGEDNARWKNGVGCGGEMDWDREACQETGSNKQMDWENEDHKHQRAHHGRRNNDQNYLVAQKTVSIHYNDKAQMANC